MSANLVRTLDLCTGRKSKRISVRLALHLNITPVEFINKAILADKREFTNILTTMAIITAVKPIPMYTLQAAFPMIPAGNITRLEGLPLEAPLVRLQQEELHLTGMVGLATLE
jgi:hypothetical protein